MRQNAPNLALFFVLSAGAIWLYLTLAPPAPPPPDQTAKAGPPSADAVAAAAGAPVANPPAPLPPPAPKIDLPPATEPPTLVALGGDKFFNQVLLTTRGGGVQQVILTKFFEADRIGHEVKSGDTPVAIHLIPGEKRSYGLRLKEPHVVPTLKPGTVTDPEARARLAEPSYTVFHYPTADDKYPDPHLGTVNWKVVEESHPADGPHRVVFETELAAPYFVRLRRTYTLAPTDYHFNTTLEITRLPGAGAKPFRYQISGPRGLPVEGEWYTNTTRTALVGYETRGRAMRQYEDATTIAYQRGGEAVPAAGGENKFRYMAIATGYFTSALVVDRSADPQANPWEHVRATTELPFVPAKEEIERLEKEAKAEQEAKAELQPARVRLERIRAILTRALPELDDITVRAVSEPVDPAAGQTVTHTYAVYNGPSKVRLLSLLAGAWAVGDATVARYLNDFQLRTITDYQSPTWLGTFAKSIYWTDLVVTFTNLMHSILWGIHAAVAWLPGSWGFSIIILTVLVRLLLFFPSRKQTAMNLRMMEVQKKLKPEIDKLHEKYKDDFRTFNQEKTRLMVQHGMNPFSALGGCLLLFAQMPIFMGLYYCLQESVFFRLQDFLWVKNLAAPDMTVWWTEGVPLISDPANRHGGFSFLYLGPYLNVFPIVAVGLMLYQQNKMMPEPTDEQQAAQQRMMKIMMGVMALLFYKVAAGLSLYFIVSTLWGIIERQLIPKPKIDADAPPKRKGFMGKLRERLQEKMEELQKRAEEQSDRQIRNDPNKQRPIRNPDRKDDGRDGKDRKKRKRK